MNNLKNIYKYIVKIGKNFGIIFLGITSIIFFIIQKLSLIKNKNEREVIENLYNLLFIYMCVTKLEECLKKFVNKYRKIIIIVFLIASLLLNFITKDYLIYLRIILALPSIFTIIIMGVNIIVKESIDEIVSEIIFTFLYVLIGEIIIYYFKNMEVQYMYEYIFVIFIKIFEKFEKAFKEFPEELK